MIVDSGGFVDLIDYSICSELIVTHISNCISIKGRTKY